MSQRELSLALKAIYRFVAYNSCIHVGATTDAQRLSTEHTRLGNIRQSPQKSPLGVIHPNHHHNKEIVMAPVKTPKCPSCNTSDFVVLDNTGEKVGTTVGVGAGAVGGYTGATGGAAAGAAIGSIVPGVGTAAGALVGGILGALSGGAVGGAVGNKVGEQIDKARKQFKCNKCGREIAG